jgi:hypothetical protein
MWLNVLLPKTQPHVPCLYMVYPSSTDVTVHVYGNGEDVSLALQFAESLGQTSTVGRGVQWLRAPPVHPDQQGQP